MQWSNAGLTANAMTNAGLMANAMTNLESDTEAVSEKAELAEEAEAALQR